MLEGIVVPVPATQEADGVRGASDLESSPRPPSIPSCLEKRRLYYWRGPASELLKEPLEAITLHAGRLREFPPCQLGPDSVVGVEAFLFAYFLGNRGLELISGYLTSAPVLVLVPCGVCFRRGVISMP